ncbi:MAG: hypothetical protein CMI63_05285 [Parvularcula sp.]|nr:hypothetical protein [Parvularcula sp.]|tara:strand:+ start:226 stop:486 length:261 start_codon:yes stop_codon:yes gene_type:complete
MKADMGKLVIAVVLDLLDFTFGRIPGFELVVDIALGVAAVALWGWPGLIAFWEIADPTGQVDAVVPTMTLIALSQMGKRKKQRPQA